MNIRNPVVRGLLVALLSASGLWWVSLAHAMPSYARQTGEECAACHVGAFGPQLTPHGMAFKLSGYAESMSESWQLPLSAMVVGNYTATAKDQPAPAHFSANDNAAMQEASLFFAGRIAPHLGAFIQATYSGVDRVTTWDNLDLRYANTVAVGGADSSFGFSLNNNPSIQDPFNTLPGWGFPYTASDLTPGYDGEPMLAGGIETQTLGLTGYFDWADRLYLEAGGYQGLSKSFQHKMGIAGEDAIDISGTSPYLRLAWHRSFGNQFASLGAVYFQTRLRPVAGVPDDRYTDTGVDASWQYVGIPRSRFTVNARYLHEKQTLDGTYATGGAEDPSLSLDEFNLNAAWYYDKTWGATLGRFQTRGSRDETLYAPEEIEGSHTGKPDSAGWIAQLDWTPFGKEDSWLAPWANLRLGLQYTAYDKFNGASSNYDGYGRAAADNDTWMGFAWLAF